MPVLANRKKLTDAMLDNLSDEVRESIEKKIENAEVESENLCLKRPSFVNDEFKIAEGDKNMAVGYSSTRQLDRDNEIVVPNGLDLSDYKKAGAVKLFNHDWTGLPVGKNLAIKSDGFGIAHKTEYGGNKFAHEVFETMKFGSLKTSSIGFIPLKILWNGSKDFNNFVDRAVKSWDEFTTKVADNTAAIITKSAMLEDSIVGVPANAGAVEVAVSKGMLDVGIASLKRMGFEIKAFEEREFDMLFHCEKSLAFEDEDFAIDTESHQGTVDEDTNDENNPPNIDKGAESDESTPKQLDYTIIERIDPPENAKTSLSEADIKQIIEDQKHFNSGKI